MEAARVRCEIHGSDLRRGAFFPVQKQKILGVRCCDVWQARTGTEQAGQPPSPRPAQPTPGGVPLAPQPLRKQAPFLQHHSHHVEHLLFFIQKEVFLSKAKWKHQGLLNTAYLENTIFHFLSVGGKGSLLLPYCSGHFLHKIRHFS